MLSNAERGLPFAKMTNTLPPPMTLAELVGLADLLAASGSAAGAQQVYRDWLARQDTAPKYFAWFNLGVMLAADGDNRAATTAYLNALDEKPEFVQARINLGRQYEEAGRVDEAIAEWLVALQHLTNQPEAPAEYSVMTLNNLGRLWEQQHRYDDAESMLTQSLAIDPVQPDVIQHWVHLRQKQCAWPVYAPISGVSQHMMLMATSPLAMLSAQDDPVLQLMAAQNFVQRKFGHLLSLPQHFAPHRLALHKATKHRPELGAEIGTTTSPPEYPPRRLRIGYACTPWACCWPTYSSIRITSVLKAMCFVIAAKMALLIDSGCWTALTRCIGSAHWTINKRLT